MGVFANITASDWISREPSLEKSTKKKTKHDSSNPDWAKNVAAKEVDQAGDGSLPLQRSSSNTSSESQGINVISVPSSFQSQTSAVVTSNKQKRKSSSDCPSTDGRASNSSIKSPNTEEYLDPVLPYQEISDKIRKDVRLKMMQLFPRRNIEMEICSELQKLLMQSSEKIPHSEDIREAVSEKNVRCLTDICEEDDIQRMDKISSKPSSSIRVFPGASSSITRPRVSVEGGGSFMVQPANYHPFYVTHTHDTHVPMQTGVTLQPQSNDIKYEAATQSKPMEFHLTTEEDSDENSGLALAQYHSFIMSSRELNSLQILQQHHNVVKTEIPKSSTFSTDSLVHKYNLPFGNCKSHQTNYCHQYSSYLEQDNDNHNWSLPMSLPISSMVTGSNHKQTFKIMDGSLPSHLDVSRHRLKTALDSVSTTYQKSRTSLGFSSDCPASNSTDYESGLGMMSTPQDDTLMDCSSYAGPSLGQMQDHQSDLQYQARDFLDRLDQEFNPSRKDPSTERRSLRSDSLACEERKEEPPYSWKRSSTH